MLENFKKGSNLNMYSIPKVGAFRSKIAQRLISQSFFSIRKSAEKRSNLLRITSGRFRPEIDGLRFFAIVPVMFSHLFEQVLRRQNKLGFLGDIPSSNYHYFINHLPGVLLFFAISGYILTYQITNASRGGYDWSKYKEYIARRFKRIAPPYYIILIATFVVVAAIGFRPSGARHFDASEIPLLPSLVGSLFYSHWMIYGDWPRLFGAGWTLEIETQYYVIAPLLTIVYLKMTNKKIRIGIGVATVFVAAGISSLYEVGNFWAGTILKFFPYFFTGMLALELQDDLQKIVRITPRIFTDLLTATAVFFYLSLHAPENGAGIQMFAYYIGNIVCIMTMFIAVSIDGNVLRRICIRRSVVIIGGACYSIYLTHYQVIFLLMNYFSYKYMIVQEPWLAMLVNAAFEVPIATLVGLIFYRLIERPFMLWGRK
jgi:peptidoglycan/LPS O-acetylase OafA/YrhL